MDTDISITSSRSNFPVTFWMTGVLGNGLLIALDEILTQTQGPGYTTQPIVLLLSLAYFLFSFPRVWNGAKSYQGPPALRFLARMFMAGLGFVYVLTLIAYPYADH